jgi:hypothetical protein
VIPILAIDWMLHVAVIVVVVVEFAGLPPRRNASYGHPFPNFYVLQSVYVHLCVL